MDAGIIAVLPDQVIDQIAAGEVVERPASVVKELCENALDAGARAIAIEIDGGGRRLVRVVDDGCGMTPRDARLALARHATSKLRGFDDLAAIATMGFRGEALPSIAAVSRLALTTRARGMEAGTRVTADGGKVVGDDVVGAPVGTTVEVADLLHNVPARLKFLRGDATEASHVTETVTRLAMAHPEVGFRLRIGGRVALELAPSEAGARVRGLLGPRLAERMHLCEHVEGSVRVRAYLAAPELAQTTSRGVHLFAGRRWIRDRALLQAVTMGYGELVPRGRYPVVVVFVDVGGGEIDVNVHPQKLEVRFSDTAAVTAAVRHAVRQGVAGAPWLREQAGAASIQMHAVASMAPPAMRRADDLASRYADDTLRALFPLGGLARPAETQTSLGKGEWERVRTRVMGRASEQRIEARRELRRPGTESGTGTGSGTGSGSGSGTGSGSGSGSESGSGSGSGSPVALSEPRSGESKGPGFFASLTYLGQLDRTYLVCEGDGEMVLIDQHAAHERVAFQRLRERAGDGVPVQRLLFPQIIALPPAEVAVAADGAALLAAVGFDVEPFGGESLAVKAVPAGLRQEPEVVLRELVSDLADRGGSRAVDERLDHVLATVACHSVVRAGDVLAADEVRSLLAQMDAVDFRAHCPHGRPVLLRIGVPEIARRFGRT